MFNKIRNQLTFVYATVMALFLILLLGAISSGMTWLVYSERRDEIRLIAQDLSDEHKDRLVNYGTHTLPPEIVSQDDNRDISGQMFYFLTDASGHLVKIDQPNPALISYVTDTMKTGNWKDNEVRVENFTLADGQKATVIFTLQKIFNNQQLLGTLFVGKDVTAYYQVLNKLLYTLLGIAILFLICATGFGHLLAGRAMIPIQQSYSRQKQFVADASHELRTPLSVLTTSLEVIQGDEGNRLTPLSRQVLNDMQDEVKKTTRIVSDLLSLARADTGNIRCVMETFELKPLVARVLRGLRTPAKQKNISMNTLGPDGLTLRADQAHIEQLIYILVDNAIKYTSLGGKITVIWESGDRATKIKVVDSGIGIPPEYQAMIFERFFRIDKARPREEGGIGLGLAIAHSIVEIHGGSISLTSSPESGSTFTISLPNQ
ncbi:MAG: HAMP domain-containing sensor histidine kinase [Negativicutes bacterium]|nr:HAMP domain-containing sensor histidine kinase [Negativicutes bacterium]